MPERNDPDTFADARANILRYTYRIAHALHLPVLDAIQRAYTHAVRHANAHYWGEPIPESCPYCRHTRPDPAAD
jgi:hypothetical protein